MKTYRLYLEDIGETWIVWLAGSTGAFANISDPAEYAVGARAAGQEHLRWLRAHGDVPGWISDQIAQDSCVYKVAEKHPYRGETGQAGPYAVIAADLQPLNAAEQRLAQMALRYAHEDLDRAAKAVPPDEWDRAPVGACAVRTLCDGVLAGLCQALEAMGIRVALNSDRTEAIRHSCETLEHALSSSVTSAPIASPSGATARTFVRQAIWRARMAAREISARFHPTLYLHRYAVADVRFQSRDLSVLW
ncbi:MAG TPA: hypothetical protein VGS41_02320 [Chthonomonadales bacterium]|nr:hypothetical protein [Chthonomonadales bacterium]